MLLRKNDKTNKKAFILVKHPKLLFDKIFTASLEGLKLIAYAVIILVINIAINPMPILN
jgi:hypothetical protein